MRPLSDTLMRMTAFREAGAMIGSRAGSERLTELDGFGRNPGALDALAYVPENLARRAPLVVVLHGCTQSAAEYDLGSGWSELAEAAGFALLFPEQARANNLNLCFNWFEPGETRRGRGEAASIRQMIEAMIVAHDLDRRRVFVTGLSAGGAMANVLLASYPEVFAGGAVIAGLPFGAAASVPQAFDAMRGHGLAGDTALSNAIRKASPHKGPWPSVSVWHGGADHTVSPTNGEAVLAQWRGVHGLAADPSHVETDAGHTRRIWRDARGRAVLEHNLVAGMGHGVPLKPDGAAGGGVSGAYMLDVGLASTRAIAAGWGLIEAAPVAERLAEAPGPSRRPAPPRPKPLAPRPRPSEP
ncbi:MAG: PHB depolymerase family esterase [Phenylobacterium sp.]|uniref:extracellular catalytic domain type 1 short-chain-length polyhydroxyalkanoate depolymerase n=1 Tax=Phenylobacterium sp. TaxID=1871053 RepID=UPI001B58088C|nr:PHB depolymerase family esterase [Phenylobacterium sp.]MBP7648490.1 PHB depolymerase family esterase [Phenylobacterium sp.]MBP7817020.1 PHB depolymerase family esterase [Phenylobacterium sp.]MBP9230446.1 PHB depolymerase family esterase [Phenylobacterium sp.]